MNSNPQQNTIIAITGFVFIVLSVSVFLLINGDFAAGDARAGDSIDGVTTYQRQLSGFESRGEARGIQVYRADSAADPYRVSGLKGLTQLGFTAVNVPSDVNLRLCLSQYKDFESSLFCETFSLNNGGTVELSETFEAPLLVGSGRDYYCLAELEFPAQSELGALARAGAGVNCTLNFAPISDYPEVGLNLSSNFLTPRFTGGLGDSLGITALTQLEMTGLAAAIGMDRSLATQTYHNLCLRSTSPQTGARNICLPDYTIRRISNQSQSSSAVGWDFPTSITTDEQLLLSCDTAPGIYGHCELFANFEIPTDLVGDLFPNGEVDLDSVFQTNLNSAEIESYCAERELYYEQSRGLVSGREKCEELLAS